MKRMLVAKTSNLVCGIIRKFRVGTYAVTKNAESPNRPLSMRHSELSRSVASFRAVLRAVRMGLVANRGQVESAETDRIGKHIDFGDFSARDRKGHHRERLPVRQPTDDSRAAVDAHGLGALDKRGEGERLLSDDPRAAELS